MSWYGTHHNTAWCMEYITWVISMTLTPLLTITLGNHLTHWQHGSVIYLHFRTKFKHLVWIFFVLQKVKLTIFLHSLSSNQCAISVVEEWCTILLYAVSVVWKCNCSLSMACTGEYKQCADADAVCRCRNMELQFYWRRK